jgi:hypothetical protein
MAEPGYSADRKDHRSEEYRTGKTGGVGFSRKSGDQTKNSFSNRQRGNNVSFPAVDFFKM